MVDHGMIRGHKADKLNGRSYRIKRDQNMTCNNKNKETHKAHQHIGRFSPVQMVKANQMLAVDRPNGMTDQFMQIHKDDQLNITEK